MNWGKSAWHWSQILVSVLVLVMIVFVFMVCFGSAGPLLPSFGPLALGPDGLNDWILRL